MRLTPSQPVPRGDSAPPSAPNRLLALPRELRDIIYEYALTEDNGLLLFERRTLGEPYSPQRIFEGRRPTDPDVESNRLKYVCRQLYHETKGLGLKLNDLAMHSRRQVEAFVAFLDTCSDSQQQCIRKVTLSDALLGHSGYLAAWDKAAEILRPYGVSHLGIEFHLYVNSLSETKSYDEWLVNAANLLYARHMHENHAILSPFMRRIAARFGADREKPIPSHIRMFPGTGPGDVVEPVFSEDDAYFHGGAQINSCIREIERWQREGV